MRRLLLFLCIGAIVCLEGCGSVPPWERGNLAQPQMTGATHPLRRSYRTHVQMSRESAAGAEGEGVGGCGCY